MLNWIENGVEIEKIRSNFQNGIRTKRDQEIQKNWGRIKKSSYCLPTSYCVKEMKNRVGREGRLSKETGHKDKEQRARLRCGNIGSVENKGFNDVECRFCKVAEESLLHIWTCKKA